jgi:hypothetical protein
LLDGDTVNAAKMNFGLNFVSCDQKSLRQHCRV